MFRTRTASALIGCVAAATTLTACGGGEPSSPSVAPVESGHEIPEQEFPYDEPPSYYDAQVIDVLSGDTMRVQLVEAVFRPSVTGTGENERYPVDPETITVKDAHYDAPAAGECGFEESRNHLITKVFGQPGPDWSNEEGNTRIVALQRDYLDDLNLPLADADGNQLYEIGYRNNASESPYQTMLGQGYARTAELLPAGSTIHDRVSSTEQRGQENDIGLWSTCWDDK